MNAASRQICRARAVAALGLLTEDSSRFDVAVIFSLILHDPIVDARARGYGFEVNEETGRDTCVMAATYEDYVEIIEQMTPQEKQELRKRIGKV
jgi:hypothetical protein